MVIICYFKKYILLTQGLLLTKLSTVFCQHLEKSMFITHLSIDSLVNVHYICDGFMDDEKYLFSSSFLPKSSIPIEESEEYQKLVIRF